MTENIGPFRAQLEEAVNARHSRMNPFTEKWVKGELTRAQLGAWVCQHYQYVSQFPRWCAAVYAECPDAGRARLPAREHHRGGVGRQARRPADPLRRGVRREPPRGGDGAAAADHARADRVVLRDVAAAVPRRRRRPARGARVAGARHLPAQPAAAQDPLRLQRPRGGVLRHPHRGRRGPRRARLPDRRAALHDRRDAAPRRSTRCGRRPRCAGST